ncbi:MAG: hypothetical protein JXA09_04060 [Anaerolineae bacterium]|nr:hypothetical protein [Anaerolineae bacterium]
MGERYRTIGDYPPREDAVGIVMRLIDGLGYRFYWATQGLRDADYAFSPGAGCMTIGELIGHVWGLANWVHGNLVGAGTGARPADPAGQRVQALALLHAIRTHIGTLDGAALLSLRIDDHPFWHVINGPLSDALTHTGQIASFRRLNGNPVPRHSVFAGR